MTYRPGPLLKCSLKALLFNTRCLPTVIFLLALGMASPSLGQTCLHFPFETTIGGWGFRNRYEWCEYRGATDFGNYVSPVDDPPGLVIPGGNVTAACEDYAGTSYCSVSYIYGEFYFQLPDGGNPWATFYDVQQTGSVPGDFYWYVDPYPGPPDNLYLFHWVVAAYEGTGTISWSGGYLHIADAPVPLQDTMPPGLTSFYVTPQQVDNSSTPVVPIVFSFEITDHRSGFNSGYALLSSPSGNQTVTVPISPASLVSGNVQDGTYQGLLTLSQYSEPGTWSVTEVQLRDNVGNLAQLPAAQLGALGFPTSFTVISAHPDTTAPVLVGLDFSPQHVDTTWSAAQVSFSFHITDDLSGFTWGYVSLKSPSGNQGYTVTISPASLISGNAQDGTYQGLLTLSQYSEPGTWSVTEVQLRDNVGNLAQLPAAQLGALGFPTSFTVISAHPDTTAPVLVGLDFSPRHVDTTTGSAAQVSCSFHITDDLSGFTWGYVSLKSPSGNQGYTVTISPASLISGNAQDGTYQGLLTLPQYSEVGTWSVTDVQLRDNVGNLAEFSGVQLQSLGFANSFTNNLEDPYMSITSSPNPSVFGQPVMFTATVPFAPSAAPTGTVRFEYDGISIGSGTPDNSGEVTISTSSVPAGSRVVTAAYSGDTSASPSSSMVIQTVNPAATTIALRSTANPSMWNQPVTFTAQITPQSGGTATGTVLFYDGNTLLGTATLNANVANLSTATLAVGSHTITASYSGDQNMQGSLGTVLQKVNKATTATTVTSSANPSVIGQSVTFTAVVAPKFGGTPTGTVQFWSKSTGALLSTMTLNAGGATYSTTFPSAGSTGIYAKYLGDATFLSSLSTTQLQKVIKYATTTSLSSGLNPSYVGQAVTFIATVSSAGGLPAGTVTFRRATTVLGTAPVSSGRANFSTSALAAGSYLINAVYGGDSNFSTSTSTSLTQAVKKLPTATSVSSSLNPSNYGQLVTFTAMVNSSGGIPSGNITFRRGTMALGTGVLTGGKAAFSTSSLNAGANYINAVYSGNSTFAASTSPNVSQKVNKIATTTSLSSSLNPSSQGQTVTFTATVASVSGAPTGTVTFKAGSNLLGTVPLIAGMGNLAVSSLVKGAYVVSATYSGGTNFLTSSASLTQGVQ